MMKIMSTTRVLLVVLVMAVLMTASMISASAANDPIEYTGTTQEDALTALQNAMATVEETGEDVTLTLKSDMFFDAGERDFMTIGTSTESEGTLYIKSEVDTTTGKPLYAITLGLNSVLNFQGNVTFDDIILDRDTADGVSYYTGSYIFVTEGTGTFGDPTDTTNYGNIVNDNHTERKSKISLAGSDLKIYTGYYMTVAANFNGSKVTVDTPSIVFGGNANAEHVVGRGAYSVQASQVTGKSLLTIQDDAYVSSVLTAGHLYPNANKVANLGGDATLNFNGGRAKNLYYLGYSLNGGTQELFFNKDDENTKSVYTINLTGGTIEVYSFLYNLPGKKANIQYADVTVNFNGTTLSDYTYGGVHVTGEVSGMTFSDIDAKYNMNGHAFTKAFFGGSFIATTNTTPGEYIVDKITRTITIENTTFADLVIFGSRFGSSSNVVAGEHSGTTTVTIDATSAAKAVALGNGGFYAGSYLDAEYSKHTGTTTVTITGANDGGYTLNLGNSTKYTGSYVRKSNTTVGGTTTFTLDGSGTNYWVNNATQPSFANNNVLAGLENVVLGGTVNTTIKRVHFSRTAFGGSILNSPVKNTTNTTLTLNPATVYGDAATYNVQFFGGDLINHSGVDNTGAISKLVIQSSANVSNTNVVYYGGSRITAAGASNAANTTLKAASGITLDRNMYGGSDLAAENAKQTGTTKLDILGGWANLTGATVFGGSRMGAAGATQSGASELIVEEDGPSTSTVFYGGSDLCTAGTVHSGSSKMTLNGGCYIRQNIYGGSNISTASTHSGASEIALLNGYIQNNGVYAFGGSYLNDAAAVQSGATKFTIEANGNLINTAGGVFGGSFIAIDGAKQTATASMIINGGNITCIHGAGSYTTLDLADTDTTDLIDYGFCQQADVYYTVNGGTFGGQTHPAGYKANIDGDLYTTINGGTFNVALFTLGGNSNNTISVSGDSILKVHGGTFTTNIVNGNTNNASTAVNTVGGVYYTEFVNDGKGEDIVFAYAKSSDDDTRTFVYLEPAGRAPKAKYANSSVYVRFVGEIPLVDAEGNLLLNWNFASRIGYVTNRYIDYTQLVGDNLGTSDMLTVSSFNHIYRHIDGINVSISDFAGADAQIGDLASLAGKTFTWYSNGGKTYEELIAFNSYTDYPNNFCIVDAATGKVLKNGIQMNTASIKVKNGDALSTVIAITSETIAAAKEAAIANARAKYEVVGTSIRLDSLAMRCRAKIDKTYFANHTGETVVDGVRIARIGFIVGLDNSNVFTFNMAGTKDAWVWADGAFNSITGNGKFAEEAQYDGYYLYQAAVTGYGTTEAIDTAHANATVYFRAYIILEDANGIQEIVYLDSPVENAGAVNYGMTLCVAAEKAKASAWYTDVLNDSGRARVDAVISAKTNA